MGLLDTDPSTLSTDALVRRVARLTERRERHAAAAEACRQAVVDTFREGRGRTPPVLQKRLADAAGITEGGVIASLRKDDKRKAEAATEVG